MSHETECFTNVECFAETAAAMLLGPEGDEDSATWVPKSLIESTDIETKGDVGYVEIQAWFVEKEGIDL